MEEEALNRKHHEEAVSKSTQEEAARIAEEAAAKRRHEEEEAAAAAAKRHQEEAQAKVAVLSVKESSPDATIASTSLQASATGAVSIKIKCPAGESSCAGTVTLRTLNAVIAGVAGVAKTKAAVLTLAHGPFVVPGGKAKTVTLHLSAKARALLARVRTLRIRVTIVAHNPAGAMHTTQTVATLSEAKPKHGS